ncbi:RHAU helicase [Carabus blaptoides fortunei]
MSKGNVSDTVDRQVEDSSETYHENQKTLGTVSVPEDLANTIKDLVKLDLSAHIHVNMPRMFLNDETVLGKIETMTLHVPKKQRGFNANMKYLAELERLEKRPAAKKIMQRRQKLPIYESKEEILEKMNKNQVTVVYGEAGCGKTTQVPQYILDNAIKSREGSTCRIVCAVPRRMNAIRAAKQVAEERGVTIGRDSPIGYYIGNENESARANASITYCTSGVILRRMLADPFLKDLTHIILDEVQERDIITDFLLRLVKSLITKRPNLKVIVMCSTIFYEQFVTYFDNCAKVKVPGLLYPVEEFYLEDILMKTNFTFSPFKKEETLTRKCSDLLLSPRSEPYPKHVQEALNDPNAEKLNLELIVAVITDINYYERDGAILVFLPGVGDITALQRMLQGSFSDLIIPIHGATVHDFQMLRTQQDKIYLATYVAESALNLDDVAYVVDTGRIKIRICDDDNTDSLKYEWISLKNVEQRRIKAGRCGPGKCYHLYKRSVIADMKPHPTPEITRRKLEEVILRMKVDSLGNAIEFFTKGISPIPEEDIQKSVEKLQAIKVLNDHENLSVLGHSLLKLSMDPTKAKMIYLGAIFSCLEPILTIAAQLITNPILMESSIRAERCTSDHIAFYQLIKQYEETDDRQKSDNHTSSILRDITVVTPEDSLRWFHIYSVNAKRTNYPSPLLAYNGIFCRNNMRYLCESTLVSPLALILFSGNLTITHETSQIFVNLSQNLRFRCDKKQTAEILVGLREKLDYIIENEISNVYDIDWSRDSENIRILRIGCMYEHRGTDSNIPREIGGSRIPLAYVSGDGWCAGVETLRRLAEPLCTASEQASIQRTDRAGLP